MSGLDWRPAAEVPPPRVACVLRLDVADNPGAGLDEVYLIGWHDGQRWYDVHGEGRNPGPWVLAWLLLEQP